MTAQVETALRTVQSFHLCKEYLLELAKELEHIAEGGMGE